MIAKGTIRLSLLGSFELEINSRPIRLPTHKSEGLLAYLVLHRAIQNRERLATIFWGDSSDELARRSLRTALSALRKELGEDFVIADRETIQLNPQYPLWVDVLELERQSREINGSTSNMDLELYRDDLLRDFYDEWILEQREQYRNLFVKVFLQDAQSKRSAGEYARVIEVSRKILSMDPACEPAYQHLIFCHGTLGDRSAALKSYEECAVQLQERLGVLPSQETNMLYEHVKNSKHSSTHSHVARSNLPIPLTSFIGREQEIQTLKEIFNKTRLLTLTGVGGCGKTRLSIQLAGQLIDQYADGIWWIELASIQDETLLVQTVKKTLGIADSQSASAEETIVTFLHSKQALLIFDNCEHVIAASASLAETILSQCLAVKILATSREALSIHGEIAWLVPSLSLPPSDQSPNILQWECPRLFFERASSYRSDLQLTESNVHALMRICRALEGIPLAIELAAARVKTLSIEQLASRLDDKLALLTTGSRTAQPRQQTLRAAIDWSFELLSEQEQIVLRRLSILTGNWTLEAAEAVASLNQLAPGASLDLITHLYEKSLLVADTHGDEVRYRMLEIIRQYAFEKLQQANEVQGVQDQHLQYYSRLAQTVRPGWYASGQGQLIRQFDAEYPNLRVALAWGFERLDDIDQLILGVKLASALGPFWNFIAEYNEGRMWLKKAIDATNAMLAGSDSKSTRRVEILSMKAIALYEYGFLVWFQSHYAQARTVFLECSEIHEQIGDATGLAFSNMFLAHSTWGLGETDLARRMWAQSLEQFHAVDEKWGAGLVHNFRGRAEREAGNYEQAEREYDECLRLFGAVGDDWGLGISYSHQGMIAFQKDDLLRARRLFEQRLVSARNIGFRQSIAYSIFLLGMAAWKLGDRVEVQKNMREALAYFHEIGNEATLTENLLGLAWAEAEEGNLEQAAFLFGAITKEDETDRIRMGFEDVFFHQPIVSDLKARLSDPKYQDALKKGQRMTLDQVAREILEA